MLAREHGERWRDLIRTNGAAWLQIAAERTAHDDDLYGGRLATLGVPALVVHGARDPRTEPGELDALRAALGGVATFAILPEGGHSPHSRARDRRRGHAHRRPFPRRAGWPPARGVMTALEFDRVSRQFAAPDGREYRALDDISFTVPAGAFVAIVGPSGCGKSTLLNLAAGCCCHRPAGPRRQDGTLTGLNRHATYMFQQDALLPWKTVRDNVALGLILAGASRADARARADRGWLASVSPRSAATIRRS